MERPREAPCPIPAHKSTNTLERRTAGCIFTDAPHGLRRVRVLEAETHHAWIEDKRYLNPQAGERESMRVLHCSTLLLGVLGTATAVGLHTIRKRESCRPGGGSKRS